MKLVIDTNVMVEAITSKNPYHKIFRSLIEGINHFVISNEIYFEYIEVFQRIYSTETLREITLFFTYSPALIKISPHYRFNLIHTDEDDNKFVDCAIRGNSDFLITSDHHFNVLKGIDFPKIEVISPGEFIKNYL